MRYAVLVSAFLALVPATGCVHSTPVTPAPLAPDKAAELRAVLPGRWVLSEVQKEGGAREPASGGTTKFVFGDDGQFGFIVEPFANLHAKWTLDGANVSTDPSVMECRIDAWTPKTLDVFVYSQSERWYFRRE